MPEFKQSTRPIGIETPLGQDKLLLEKFWGAEMVSRPYRFNVAMLAEPKFVVPFDKLLGQKVSVRLDVVDSKEPRYFHGVITQLSEGPEVVAPDLGVVFLRYFAQIVPEFYLLQRNLNSRIFQRKSVVDILKVVLKDLTVKYDGLDTYDPRDYCAQYRETDFEFASRLMEEEGIYYYFEHTKSGHTMILGDKPSGHLDLPKKKKIEFGEYRGLGDRSDLSDRITRWAKTQELRSGKSTLRDFCFEMPDNNFQKEQVTQASTSVGTTAHSLNVGGNSKFELYDFPGGFAQRYDGHDRGGAKAASELGKISDDGVRTVKIRMQAEAAAAVNIRGEAFCRRLAPGYKFDLAEHFSANGSYVLTQVEHVASVEGAYTTNDTIRLSYGSRFDCLPADLPFRPERRTPRPIVRGTHTGIVVGEPGAEISTDTFGRVKVQFHWDRDGKKDLDSSCWIRVAQPVAGKGWGGFYLPRVGQEVIVDFLEGDPDQPIVVGSVYNAETVPPYTLPDFKTRTLLKTRSTPNGTEENFNELRFEDKKDEEEVYFHAEKDFNRVVENNDTLKVGFDKKDPGDQTIDIYNARTTTLENGDDTLTVKKASRITTINVDDTLTVETGNRVATIDQGNDEVTVTQGDQTIKVAAGSQLVEAGTMIELKVGSNSIVIDQMGITIKAAQITIEAESALSAKGLNTDVNGDAALNLKGGMVNIN